MSNARAPALSRRQILSYSIYAAPLMATTVAIGSFIPPYYSGIYGVPLAVVATSLMLIRLIDAVCDPLIGAAIDYAPFRQRHRPWLLIALPIFIVAITLLFFPPPALAEPAYLVAAGGAAYIAFTIGMVSHQAWAAALIDDPSGLSRLFGYREVAVIAGILGVFGLAAIAAQIYGGDVAAQARAAAIFILGSITLCTFITYAGTPDPVVEGARVKPAGWVMLRPFLLSRKFVLLSLAVLLYNSAWTALGAMSFFLADHIFRSPASFSVSLAWAFIVAPVGMAGWMKLAKRRGDAFTLCAACLYLALAIGTLPLAARFNAAGWFGFQTLMGLGFGAGPYLLRSLTGVLANDYIAATGLEVRGAAFAMTNFFDKAGSGLGASSLLPLAWAGFDPAHGVDSAARSALLALATAIPLAGFLLTALLIKRMHREKAA